MVSMSIHSPRPHQSLSLIPRSSLSPSGISSIRLQFLGSPHDFTNSKFLSRRRNSRKRSASSPPTNPSPASRTVASLNSGQILVAVGAAVSAVSFVYLNYFSKRKKYVQKAPPKKHNGTELSDLTVDAFDVENVKEVVHSVGEAREEAFKKEAHDYQHQRFHTLESTSVDGDVNPLDLPGSLGNDQHSDGSWKFEGNGEVALPLHVRVPESDITATQGPEFESERREEETETAPAYKVDVNKSLSGSVSEGNSSTRCNDHAELEATGFVASHKESTKEDLHLFYVEDQSVATVDDLLHAQGYSQASNYISSSALTSSDTVETLEDNHHLLPSGYSGFITPEHKEGNGYMLTYEKRSKLHTRKDKATETRDNLGPHTYDNQHLYITRTRSERVLQKRSLSQRLGSYSRLLKYGSLKEGLKVLEEMDKEGALDMNKVYHSKFLSLCRSQKAVNEAFRFVKLIQNPTLSTFNMLMSVCSSAQDSDGATKVWQLVQQSGFKPDCKLYTTMISTYGKSGKVDAMFKVFHEMVTSEVEPNLHTYGALIDGCARSGQIAKAFGAYGILRSKKVKPDRVIFNVLITACGRSGAVDRAFGVLQEMREEPHPIDPDHITIGALMKACINVGQVDRVEEVYEMIQQYNIKGTPELYTIAVSSCSQTGDWTFACNIFNDMRKNGVEPDEMFLSALIDVAGHAGNINAAFEVLQEASLDGMKIGILPYSSLMGACCSTKSWRKALELYEEIKSLSLVPTVTTFNALITVLCECNQLEKALGAFKEMKNMGLSPNEITYSVLFVASEKNDDLDAGLMLLSETKRDNLPLNMVMSKCLLGMCLRRFQKSAALGEVTVSFKSGKPQIENNWASLAVSIYREAIAASMTPSMDVLSQVLGCLQLPANMSLREGIVELLGVEVEALKSENFYSLIDGFGEYDLRAFSLLEEAVSLGIVPSVSFKGNPIVIDARNWQIHIGEVYLLMVLKGLKHRLAAGAKLPTVSILLPVEVKTMVSLEGEEMTDLALSGRAGQAIGAMLRRRGLAYLGNESYGKIRISGRSIMRWVQPKSARGMEMGLSAAPKLGKQIEHQQRNIRTENYTIQ